MVWVESAPVSEVPIPLNDEEPVIKLIHAPHTPLVIALTKTSVLIYHQSTLLPLTCHNRLETSLNNQGYNLDIKVKHVSVDTAQLVKVLTINLFIQTDLNYLIIYQVFINYNKSLFEVYNKSNGELLQNSLPLSDTSSLFSLTNLIKSATKTIMLGNENHVNLENIEHFNNGPIEDKTGDNLPYVKLSIFKVLKISIGIDKFWVRSNSHNLIILNNFEFQIINLNTFHNQVWNLKELEWFGQDWQIKSFNYNVFHNYFILINQWNEVWFGNIESNLDSKPLILGEHLFTLTNDFDFCNIIFNPQLPLILIQFNSSCQLFKLETLNKIRHFKFQKIIYDSKNCWHLDIKWSPCGEYLIFINTLNGFWNIYSKFGNSSFDSFNILNELTDHENDALDFLKASKILISPNSLQLYILNRDQTSLYLINLLKSNGFGNQNVLLYNKDYISQPSLDDNMNRFPISSSLKKILTNIEFLNGSKNDDQLKNLNGNFKISYNTFNQIGMSFGNHVSVSTPTNDGFKLNHVLWFNFHDYYMETLNIIDHFWYDDYLILINRFVKDEEILIDELIVLDTTLSKYGHGGSKNFIFDSDLIIWRHNFNNQILSHELSETKNHQVKNLTIIGNDMKIIIVELSKDKINPKTNKQYRIFIGVNKRIHLSSIQHKIELNLIQQVSMIEGKHFLLLLRNGDFYLLRNQTQVEDTSESKSNNKNPIDLLRPNNNMYDLIKIQESVEYFQIKSLENFATVISLFNGDSLLIYNLFDMIESAFDNSNYNDDGLDDSDQIGINAQKNVIDPIDIKTFNNNYPLSMNNLTHDKISESIELLGLEVSPILKSNVFYLKHNINHQLILNNFIEYDLYNAQLSNEKIITKYEKFQNFKYCLELILFNQLTSTDEKLDQMSDNSTIDEDLKKIMNLIEDVKSDSIYINCLRKVEVGYWHQFFETLNLSPVEYMNRLIESQDVELCYNFLIVYLNFKKEFDDDFELDSNNDLDNDDEKIILTIIQMLDDSAKWDSCFELCRFIKLLDPSNKLLKSIKNTLNK